MAIPAFQNGFLPVGPFAGPFELVDEMGTPQDVETFAGWTTDQGEIHQRLVMKFTETATRQALHHEMTQMVSFVCELVPCALFFLSGAFCTDVTDPKDLHLALVLPPSAVDALTGRDHWLLHRLFDDREALFGGAEEFRLTTELAVAYPVGHHRYEDAISRLAALRRVASFPLDDDRLAGYLQFPACEGGEPGDVETIALLADADSST